METIKGLNKDGEHTYDYVTCQSIVDGINDGTLTFNLPFYEEQEGKYSYNKRFINGVIEKLERKIKRHSERSKEEQEKWLFNILCHLGTDCLKHETEFENPKQMIWIQDSGDYTDYMSGEWCSWLYLDNETNIISLYNYKTKQPLVTQPSVFSNKTKTVEIDCPSGQLVFGYYNVFDVFEDRDEERDNYADYFNSQQEKKNFLELYQNKNVAMWYDGGFTINDIECDGEPNGNFRFVDECNSHMGSIYGQIEHDKCTCLVDMDTLLAKVEGTEHTFENDDSDKVPFSKENMLKESNVDSEYKALQVIEVPKGKYRISIVDYKDRTEVYDEFMTDEFKGCNDHLDYTLYGGIELIEKY